MKALLDTSTFLWWILDSPRLSSRAREFIADARHELYFSAASAWEISIKMDKGTLKLPKRPAVFLEQQLADNSVQVLPVDLRHALQVAGLPPHHKDPFDRMLVAQAMIEGLAIVTSDEAIAQYTPEVIW